MAGMLGKAGKRMDLEKKFEEFEKKLGRMSMAQFEEMLIRCGIERIKPSAESDYIRCLKKAFSEKEREYCVKPAFKSDAFDQYNNFGVEDSGQGAA